jgi:Glycosyltransferase like family 2
VTHRSRLRPPAGLMIATLILARQASGYRNLHRTLRFLADRDEGQPSAGHMPVVHIVVPMLREQPTVPAAMDWYAHILRHLPTWTVTFVTTAREDAERDLLAGLASRSSRPLTAGSMPQATRAELAALEHARRAASGPLGQASARAALAAVPTTSSMLDAALGSAELDGLAMRHVHYPGSGRKAAQVNYAASTLSDADDSSYLAVYDADSRPEPADLARIGHRIGLAALRDGSAPQIVQQSARFAVTQASPGSLGSATCRGAATLQTLWTLRREIPSFRRYEHAIRTAHGRPVIDCARRGLAQTVGHGLFVRRDVFEQLGGLPEKTFLDDVPFGYRATMRAVQVEVVPHLETAEAPGDARELVSQSKRWFRSYLDYPSMARETHAAGVCTRQEQAVALSIAAYRGAAWLLRGPAALAALALTIRPGHPATRALSAAALWFGYAAPLRALAELEDQAAVPSATRSAELFTAAVLSSVGPFLALADAIRRSAGEGFSPKARRS